MHRFLKLATKEVLQHPFEDRVGFRLCSILVKGGAVVATGFNKYARNSFVEHFSRFDTHQRDFFNTHAEMAAVQSARAKTDLTDARIYISRVLFSGEMSMARPCVVCEHVLFRYGIKKAYYTIDAEHYGIMQIQAAGRVKDKIIRVGD